MTVTAGAVVPVFARRANDLVVRRFPLRSLVPAGYLLAAVALTARLWVDPAGRAVAGNPMDNALATWFIRYSATAIGHGHLPALITTALNAPRGTNLMWNTSLLLPGVLLTPVTLVAGPQASLTVLVTAGFCGSAVALYVVLRRWGAGWPAAAFGGFGYGFSPALAGCAVGHYNLQFAVLPPLIIDAALRVATGRGSPGTAVWLGVLAAAQLFTGEELLADTAVVAAILVLGLAAARRARRAGPARGAGRAAAATAARQLTAAAATALALTGYALWVQFRGPLREHGIPWPADFYAARPAAFVTPSAAVLLHTGGSAVQAAHYPAGRPEYLAYLGIPLLLLVAAATVACWRDLRVRLTATAFAVLEVFALGGGSALLPWHWVRQLPLLAGLLPDRFSILADGLAAATLAFALSRQRERWPRPAVAAIAALAVLPVIPLPLQAARVSGPPAPWPRAAAGRPVLIVPDTDTALTWQARGGVPASIVGSGDVLVPDLAGRPSTYLWQRRPTARYLAALWYQEHPRHRPSRGQIKRDVAYWKLAAIVTVTRPGSALARFLDGEFGAPVGYGGGVYRWVTR